MVVQNRRLHNQGVIKRRTEPRYLVKEDAFVWDLRQMKAGYHPARIVDVSRNGMRLESAGKLTQGTDVAIDFRGMIICGTVHYSGDIGDRFAVGIRIKDVLDPLRQEPANHSTAEDGCVKTTAVLA